MICGDDYSRQSSLKSCPPSFPFVHLMLVNRAQLWNFTTLCNENSNQHTGHKGGDKGLQKKVIMMQGLAFYYGQKGRLYWRHPGKKSHAFREKVFCVLVFLTVYYLHDTLCPLMIIFDFRGFKRDFHWVSNNMQFCWSAKVTAFGRLFSGKVSHGTVKCICSLKWRRFVLGAFPKNAQYDKGSSIKYVHPKMSILTPPPP